MTENNWLTVTDAAKRARCGRRSIYLAARAGLLRAARLGGRKELRFREEWIDGWLESTAPAPVQAPNGSPMAA